MLSIIICSVNGTKFATISDHYHHLLQTTPHEILGIHDAKSICEGYNRALAQSKGDTLIFSHDDIEILTPDFATRLQTHMQNHDLIGVAGTDKLSNASWSAAGPPYIFGQVAHSNPKGILTCLYGAPRRVITKIQAMDGLFLAFRRHIVESLQWDEQTFTGWHCYDIDITFRAYLAGHKTAVVCDIPILHHSQGTYDDAWQLAAKRFHQKHLGKFPYAQTPWHQFAATLANTREEAVTLMTPRHWDNP